MGCDHQISEMDTAVHWDALCPLCLKDRVELLEAALKECADSLADEVEGHYRETKDHPAMKRRYDRDMAPAVAAYKLLGIEKEPAVG